MDQPADGRHPEEGLPADKVHVLDFSLFSPKFPLKSYILVSPPSPQRGRLA